MKEEILNELIEKYQIEIDEKIKELILEAMELFAEKKYGKKTNLMEIIRKVVSQNTHIPEKIIDIKTRDHDIVGARQLCHHFSKEYTNESLSVIGEYFGNKDHATVLHSYKTVNNLRDTNKNYRLVYQEIDKTLKELLKSS